MKVVLAELRVKILTSQPTQQCFQIHTQTFFFVSGGLCNDIENVEKTNGGIIQTLLCSVQIINRDERATRKY